MDRYKESLDSGFLPPSLTKALITHIPKPDKPQTKSELYSLVSLIKTDGKILAKVQL